MAAWLKGKNAVIDDQCDQHNRVSKPILAILWCPWEKYFTTLSPAWRSEQAALNICNTSKSKQNNNKKT